MLAVLIISVMIYCLGCIADAATSVKFDGTLVREKSRFYKDKSGKFVLYKYALLNAAAAIIQVLMGIYIHPLVGSTIAIFGAVKRFRGASQNEKMLKSRGL